MRSSSVRCSRDILCSRYAHVIYIALYLSNNIIILNTINGNVIRVASRRFRMQFCGKIRPTRSCSYRLFRHFTRLPIASSPHGTTVIADAKRVAHIIIVLHNNNNVHDDDGLCAHTYYYNIIL